MTLSERLTTAHNEIPGCIAVGVMDLVTKTLVERSPSSEAAPLERAVGPGSDLLAAGVPDGSGPGNARSDDLRETVVVAEQQLHVLVRMPAEPEAALLAVCAGGTKLALALVACRAAAEQVGEAL